MKALGNLLWHIPFMGFVFAFVYCLYGALLCCTVILLPLGLGYFQIAKFMLAPFSNRMVSKKDLVWIGREDSGTGMKAFSLVVRILFFPFGVFAALSAIGLVVAEFITILGIPSALVWAKLIPSIFNPINKVCVTAEEADLIAQRKAEARAAGMPLPTGDSEAAAAEPSRLQTWLTTSLERLKNAPLAYKVTVVGLLVSFIFGFVGYLVSAVGLVLVARQERERRLSILLLAIGLFGMGLIPPLAAILNKGMVYPFIVLFSLVTIAGGLLQLRQPGNETLKYGVGAITIWSVIQMYWQIRGLKRSSLFRDLTVENLDSGVYSVPEMPVALSETMLTWILSLTLFLLLLIGIYLILDSILEQKSKAGSEVQA